MKPTQARKGKPKPKTSKAREPEKLRQPPPAPPPPDPTKFADCFIAGDADRRYACGDFVLVPSTYPKSEAPANMVFARVKHREDLVDDTGKVFPGLIVEPFEQGGTPDGLPCLIGQHHLRFVLTARAQPVTDPMHCLMVVMHNKAEYITSVSDREYRHSASAALTEKLLEKDQQRIQDTYLNLARQAAKA